METIKDKYEFKINTIYCGNNIKILPDFPAESVDLIYIDPPFSSDKIYNMIWGDSYEKEAYNDRWEGDIKHYIEEMIPKIQQLHRILKSNGSFYLHCNYVAGHYLKVECDEIFGIKNFRNEIIWHYKNKIGRPTKKFLSDYDTILFYSKSDDYIFNPQFVEIDNPLTLKRYDKIDENGRRYKVYHTNNVNRRVYLKPKSMGEVWEINNLSANSRERLGYPTQKPEALLERIIRASSNEGDIVLDAFCGCGTTLAIAKKLKRKWIGIDLSPVACKEMAKRINYRLRNIVGMKYTVEELKKLTSYEFQTWCCERIGGIVNPKKTSDYGEDGWVYINGRKHPIEVKQSSVGRPVVQKFESVIRRCGSGQGFIIGLRFVKNSVEEISRINNIGEIKINPLTAEYLCKIPSKKKPKEDILRFYLGS